MSESVFLFASKVCIKCYYDPDNFFLNKQYANPLIRVFKKGFEKSPRYSLFVIVKVEDETKWQCQTKGVTKRLVGAFNTIRWVSYLGFLFV
jgi:hypothetical protein